MPLNKWILFLVFSWSLVSCGKKQNPDMGNADVVYEWSGEKKVEELGLTIYKVVVWKSASNSSSSGVLSINDAFLIDLRFKLDGDVDDALPNSPKSEASEEEKISYENSRYRRAQLGLFWEGGDGELYGSEDYPIGATTFKVPNQPAGKDGIWKYTVNPPIGLVAEKFPSYVVYSDTTGPSSDRKTNQIIIKAHEIKDSGWENVFNYQIPSAALVALRTRYVENKDLATKGKLGCLVKPATSSGELQEVQYKFFDVELGNTFYHSENKIYTSQGIDSDELGDDDQLWIPWTEGYYLAGYSLNTHAFQFLRVRSAPFYLGRELPGVDTSDKEPKLSGIDNLVHECNKAAGASSGNFQIMSLVGASNLFSPNITLHGVNSYCSSLANVTDRTKLATTSSSYDDCAFGITGLVGGTWDGSAHTGAVTFLSNGINYLEMSKIVEVKL